MLTLLHLSDLHFGPPHLPLAAEAALACAHEIDPSIVVVSGDITQRAKQEQFGLAREFLSNFPAAKLLVVPGNHDVPLYRLHERLFCPYRNYRHFVDSNLHPHLIEQGLAIAGVNTTAPLRTITNGRIDQGELQHCQRVFNSAPKGALRVVVAHHHFVPAPDYAKRESMPGARQALEFLSSCGVDLIMGGHLHRAYIGNSLDAYGSGSQEHGIIIVQCGTTTSSRGRLQESAKNSLNVVQVDEREIHVTHYLFQESSGRFLPSSRHSFMRRPRLQLESEV